ncbi:MAG: hypothetical protein LBF95_05200 [Treponema sp.]|jgi:hypothetical protein|nr:hypothetical protein [Treponema sp.]
MPKKIAKYTLPRKDADLDTLANSVRAYCAPHLAGSNPDWPDIPLTSWTAFTTALAVWTPAYEACKVPHLPSQTAAKNLAKQALEDSLTELLLRGLLMPPRTVEDILAMGFHLADTTHTPVEEVKDTVDIDSIANGTVPGTHVHILHYHIQGNPHRSKAPYQMAVFQVYIRGPNDSEPVLESEDPWGADHTSMNEPFEVHHKPEYTGKTAYYRARWQAFGGIQGPWTMAAALIP